MLNLNEIDHMIQISNYFHFIHLLITVLLSTEFDYLTLFPIPCHQSTGKYEFNMSSQQ